MASSASRVAIIFGAGSNIGASLVKRFVGAGYRVATVSRSASAPNSDGGSDKTFHVQADLSDPSAAHDAFAQVTQSAGWPFPSVVVWNASSMTPPAAEDPKNPLAVPGAGFDRDVAFMVKAPYVAAGEAVRAWREAEGARRGTFIMTGNMAPRRIFPIPAMTMLGVGKSGANYWVGAADAALKEEGIRFFFADERGPDGGPAWSEVNGESHAEMYLELVEGKEDLPYYVTFRNGKYVKLD